MAQDNNYYFVHDRLGSVRAVVNNTGAVVSHYTYDAFGKLYAEESLDTIDNPFRYTGEFFDKEINQYYLRARMYDPTMRRFTGRDPIEGSYDEPLTLHRYMYCWNNPINNIDPSGELPCFAEDIAGTIASYEVGLYFAVEGTEAYMQGDYNFGDFMWNMAEYLMTDVMMSYASGPFMMPGTCFTADTEIMTSVGEVPIQYIQVGDLVWTKDVDSGEVKLGKVADTFVRQAPEIVTVTVAGEAIETTTNHPFWVNGKGWTEAGDLSLCDEVVTYSGETLEVENISIVAAPTPVYNFEVEGTHTYYVSGAQVLVHNANCPKGIEGIDDLPKKFLKDPQKLTTVTNMIDKIKRGNFTNTRHIKGPFWEMRDASGIRVYYKIENGIPVIRLIGDKTTQERDIAKLI